MEWKPERVLSWCAYSAAWWDQPQKSEIMPPGIVVCGRKDERNGASLLYFKQGRALGKPWLWVELAQRGHAMDHDLDRFVRAYFEAILQARLDRHRLPKGVWLDIDQGDQVDPATIHSTLSGWIPHESLVEPWRVLNGIK
ncbi:MAG: hypothetical protein HC904_10560 [Blastochloris sp.]|nr:hypothetical protein [Blastochloris sp.]